MTVSLSAISFLRLATSELRPGESEPLADDPQQRRVGRDVRGGGLPVYYERDRRICSIERWLGRSVEGGSGTVNSTISSCEDQLDPSDGEERFMDLFSPEEHVAPPPEPGRRQFLRRGLAFGAGLAVAGAAPGRAQSPPVPDDPSKVLGGPVRPYGERSRFERAERIRRGKTDEIAVGNRTPLDETLGIITPSSLHFEVHRGGVPDIDPRKHRLLIHGMVDRPVILTVEEIRRLPSTSRILFLECQGNSQTEWAAPTLKTVQMTHGLTSCSEWTGVPLALLLREAGVQKGAAWILAEGADANGSERGLPIAKAMAGVRVASGQTGEAVRPAHGP